MFDFERPICLPILALRGLCVFPKMLTHFDVGRKKSARAVEEAMREDQMIFLVTQKDVQMDDPKREDLYEVGTVAVIKQILRMPGDNMRILVEGRYRARMIDLVQREPYLFGKVITLSDANYNAALAKAQATVRQAQTLMDEFVETSAKNLRESTQTALATDDAGYIADYIGQYATFSYKDKQKLLEQLHPLRRAEAAVVFLTRELDIIRLENKISENVQERVDKNQRDYYLREQLHAIHEELGDTDDEADTEEYRRKIRALALPEQTEEKLLKEVKRLAKQQSNSAEAALLRNYLDLVLELPWNTKTEERLNVAAAKKILDADHFGLEKVKERILETLAVRQLSPELPGQILCLVGPPGVGKTSVAISIARALNRNLARISLGGVHDEAEIRGHRKTYIGAMPGRIMAGLVQAKSKNALLLLDEIDKLGSDYKGD
ncbi:MAG: LON peptidase substrate-binding domain-containing protein, partial [Oscillospiraceae bacterium]|nr:LON peptidase substrate-binding domain-containing protein [Oscillospiraceae bacterium]